MRNYGVSIIAITNINVKIDFLNGKMKPNFVSLSDIPIVDYHTYKVSFKNTVVKNCCRLACMKSILRFIFVIAMIETP